MNRYFLLQYTIRHGECEFDGHSTIGLSAKESETEEKLKTEIHDYFMEFYGEDHTNENEALDYYMYLDGEFMVKKIGYREITKEQIDILNSLGL